ncbi:MAG: hypothetical protein M1348_00840 [Candidatus Parvarchaeota archaeon]|jgi:ribosomal protein S24E|nr:hypothetical protein [Candidatus Parvarchaeota archaeon]MCL5101143.1 hypothetical protein [Candidatus Parvarchaeota archaeon]
MEFKITSKTHDKFFDRMLVNFRVKLGPKETIKIDDAKKLLSDQSKDGFIVIYSMKNSYGSRNVNGLAHIYKDEESAKALLQRYILKKNGVIYAERKEEKAETK